jgi:hypothetical protein
VHSRGENHQAALDLATRAADGVLSSLVFVSGAGAGPLEPLAIFADGDGGCNLRQFVELPLGPTVARMVGGPQTERALFAIDGLASKRRERIFTAMSWFRKAAFERQPIDAFTAAWLGLETLNALLAEHYGVSNERVERRCPKCDEPVIVAPTSAGIRDLLTTLGGPALWDDARRRRVALLHATRPLAEVHADLPALARQLTHALRHAVLLLSGFSPEAGEAQPTTMSVPRRHRARVDVFLPDYSVAQLPRGPHYPSMRLHRMQRATRTEVNGRTVEQIDSQWALVNFSGEKYKFAWKLEPDVDPDDSAVTAEMRFLGQEPWPAGTFDEERRTEDPSA